MMDSSSESDSESCGYLVFFLKKGEQTYWLFEGETTIGSSFDAHIRFNKIPQLAPIHCSIDANENGIATIFNNCTADPVKVNGAPVKDCQILLSCDFIEVMGKKFRYHNTILTNEEIEVFGKEQFSASRRTKIPPRLSLRKHIRRSESVHLKLPNSEKKSKRHTVGRISFNTRKSTRSTRNSSMPIRKSLNASLPHDSILKESPARKSLSNARKSRASIRKSQLNESYLLKSPVASHSPLIDRNESSLLNDSILEEDEQTGASSSRKSATSNRRSSKYLLVDLGKSSVEDNDARKSRAGAGKTRESILIDLGTDYLSPVRKSQAGVRKSKSLEDSLMINLSGFSSQEADDENVAVSPKRVRATKSPASTRKSSLAVVIDRDISAVKDNNTSVSSPARQSRSTMSRRSLNMNKSINENGASPRMNGVLITPNKLTVTEFGDSETPNSEWSTKTIESTTPKNSTTASDFRTSTARKNKIRSLSAKKPILDHNYCKRGSKSLSEINPEDLVDTENGIDDLEEAFPTKMLQVQRSNSSSYNLGTPIQNKTPSSSNKTMFLNRGVVEDIDLPSPILPEKITKALVSNLHTPDQARRSATKLGVRWSTALVSIHTPESTKMSSRSLKSALQEYIDVNPTDRSSTDKSDTSNQSWLSVRSRKSSTLNENDYEDVSPKIKTRNNSRISIRSRKSSALQEDIDVNATNRLSNTKIDNSSQSWLSVRSRKSSSRNESDTEDVSPSRTSDRMSKSKNETPNQSKMSVRSRKSSALNESIIEDVSSSRTSGRMSKSKVETPNQSRMSIKSSATNENNIEEVSSTRRGDRLSKTATPNHSIRSSKSRKSALEGDCNLADLSQLDNLNVTSRLSKSATGTLNQSNISTRSRQSAVQDESVIIDLVEETPKKQVDKLSESMTSAVDTPNLSKVSTRSRKSALQDQSVIIDLVEESPAIFNHSRSRRSTVADVSNLDDMNVSITSIGGRLSKTLTPAVGTFNRSGITTRSRRPVVHDESDIDVEEESPKKQGDRSLSKTATLNESRMSSKSRRSTVRDMSNLNDLNLSVSLQDGSDIDVEEESPKKQGDGSLSKTADLNQSRISSKLRRSTVADVNIFDKANASIISIDDRLSKSLTPAVGFHNQSKISTRSRKSAVQDESDIDLEEESPKKLGNRSLSKATSLNQSRMSSQSGRSTVADVSDIDLEVESCEKRGNGSWAKRSTFNRSTMSSKSRRSTVSDVYNFDESNVSIISIDDRSSKTLTPAVGTRSRKSTVQDESNINLEEGSPKKQGDRAWSTTATLNHSRSRRSTIADLSNFDDSNVSITSIGDGLSKSAVRTPNRSKISIRSRKSAVQDESDIDLEDESSKNLGDRAWSTTATLNHSRSHRSTLADMSNLDDLDVSISLQDESDIDVEEESPKKQGDKSLSKTAGLNQSRISSKSRRSTVADVSNFDDSNVSIISIDDRLSKSLTPAVGFHNQSKISTRSHKSAVQDESDIIDLDEQSPKKEGGRLTKSLTPAQSRTSKISRKSTVQDESNLDQFADIPSPEKNVPYSISRKSTVTSSDFDLPSPIPAENVPTKSFISNLRTPDTRRSSRSRRSTFTDNFEYTLLKPGNEGTYVISDETTTISQNDSSEATDADVFNATYKKDESAAIITINDTVDQDLETTRRSTRRSKSTPYMPITEDITPASTEKVPGARNSPKNDLSNVHGVKNLFATPKEVKSPKNDLTEVPNLRRIMSPRQQNSPANRLSDFKGVRMLMKTPRAVKQPLNDLRDVGGVKKLMKTPRAVKQPLNDLRDVRGVKKLMMTPRAVKQPLNDLTDVKGVKKLMASPRGAQKEPFNRLSDFEGVTQLFNASLHSNTSNIENNEELFSKIFERPPLKTYRSKSLTMSPKQVDAYGTKRKSILDKPFVSPRVGDWIEEQATLKQKITDVPPKSLQEAVAVEESSTPITRKRKAKKETVEPEVKKTKVVTRDKTNVAEEIETTDTSKMEQTNKNGFQQITQVKKKVTFIQETTYEIRHLKEEDKKPDKSTRGKKEQTELEIEELPAQTAESPKKRVYKGKKIIQKDEESELPPSRSRRGQQAPSENADQKKKPATRSHRGKQEPEEKPKKDPKEQPKGRSKKANTVDDEEEKDVEVVEVTIAHKPRRGAAKKSKKEEIEDVSEEPKSQSCNKEVEHEEKPEVPSGRSRRGKTAVKPKEDLKQQPAQRGRPKRGNTVVDEEEKVVEVIEETTAPKSRRDAAKKSKKEEVEEDASEERASRSKRGNTVVDEEEKVVEVIEETTAPKSRRGAAKKSKKEEVEEDASKEELEAPSGRSRRGNTVKKPKEDLKELPKQTGRSKKVNTVVDEEEKVAEVVKVTTAPKSRRGAAKKIKKEDEEEKETPVAIKGKRGKKEVQVVQETPTRASKRVKKGNVPEEEVAKIDGKVEQEETPIAMKGKRGKKEVKKGNDPEEDVAKIDRKVEQEETPIAIKGKRGIKEVKKGNVPEEEVAKIELKLAVPLKSKRGKKEIVKEEEVASNAIKAIKGKKVDQLMQETPTRASKRVKKGKNPEEEEVKLQLPSKPRRGKKQVVEEVIEISDEDVNVEVPSKSKRGKKAAVLEVEESPKPKRGRKDEQVVEEKPIRPKRDRRKL